MDLYWQHEYNFIYARCTEPYGTCQPINKYMKYTNPARGTPDFCKQKLLAPPLEPGNHLKHYNHGEQFQPVLKMKMKKKMKMKMKNLYKT